MKHCLKITSALLVVSMMFGASVFGVSAFDEPEVQPVVQTEEKKPDVKKTAENLKNIGAGPMGIAHKGDWRHYPENTVAGALSAAEFGADIVEVDVRRTADGYLVVFDDVTLDRMCVDDQGNSVNGRIDEITLEKLRGYRLREGQGGPLAKVTEYTVPTLDEMLTECKNIAFLRIDHAWEYRDDVYHALLARDMLGEAMLNSDASAAEINEWVKSTDNAPMVVGAYKGMVVFSANGTLRQLQKGGQPVVELSTSNIHAILFDNVVTRNFGDTRVLIDTTKPEFCGDRADGASGWDDLLGRGYTLFQTDSIEAFVRYREAIKPAKVALTSVAGTAQALSLNLNNYDSKSADNLTKELEAAQKLLANGGSAGQIEAARASLQVAVDNLKPKDLAKEQETAFKVTPLRAVLAVIALAAVILVQVYIYFKSDNHKIAKAKRKSEKAAEESEEK